MSLNHALRSIVSLCAGFTVILALALPPPAVAGAQGRHAATATVTNWRLARDFRIGAQASNPNPDRMGNAAVWYFMIGTDLSDPGAFTLLPAFVGRWDHIRRLAGWLTRPSHELRAPWAGVNKSGETQYPITLTWPEQTAAVHPGQGGVNAIVGWRSPITGTVHVRVTFSDLDANYGDGITWAIDKDAATLMSGLLPNGGAPQTRSLTIEVSAGTFLYFAVGPNGDYGWDSTGVDVTIRPVAQG